MSGMRRCGVVLGFIAGLACAAPAFAQTTGVLKGRVIDPQKSAVPGATVTVSSPELQGVREAVTRCERRLRRARAAAWDVRGRG